jgi:hypothetical protein
LNALLVLEYEGMAGLAQRETVESGVRQRLAASDPVWKTWSNDKGGDPQREESRRRGPDHVEGRRRMTGRSVAIGSVRGKPRGGFKGPPIVDPTAQGELVIEGVLWG